MLYRWIEAVLNGLTNGYRALAARRADGHGRGRAGRGAGGRRRRACCSSSCRPSCRRSRTAARSSALGIAPEGSTSAYTDRYVKRDGGDLPQTRRSSSGSSRSSASPTVTQGINFVRLVDWDERPLKQQDIAESLLPKLFAHSRACSPSPSNPPSLGQSPIDKPVQFVLQTSQPYEELQQAVDQLLAAARQNPGLQQPRQRPQAQQAAAQGHDRPRQGGADWASTSRRSAGRWRPCSAAGRSRASSATASSTT